MKAWKEGSLEGYAELSWFKLVKDRKKNNQGVLTDCSKLQKGDKAERQYWGNFFKSCASENTSQWQQWADATSYFPSAIPLLHIYHQSLTDRAICIVCHLSLAACLFILCFSVCIIPTKGTSCSLSLCEGFSSGTHWDLFCVYRRKTTFKWEILSLKC